MATTKKLVYSESLLSVKPKDVIQTEDLGQVIVRNVHAPRKRAGQGRITVSLADGRICDYPPAAIGAKWA